MMILKVVLGKITHISKKMVTEEKDIIASTKKLYHAHLLRTLQEADAKMPDVYMQTNETEVGKILKYVKRMMLKDFVKVYNHPNCRLTYRRNIIQEIVAIYLEKILMMEEKMYREGFDVDCKTYIQPIISTLQVVIVELENYKNIFESGESEKYIPCESFKKIVTMYTKKCMDCFII